MGNTDYITKFFNQKVYRKDWEVTTDREIILKDFEEFVQKLTLSDKIRMFCFDDLYEINDIKDVDTDKTLKVIRNTLIRLNKSLELEVEKNLTKNIYKTTNKGMKKLIISLSSFYRENQYLKQFTTHNLELEIFDSKQIIKAFHNFITEMMSSEINKVISEDIKYIEINFTDICEYDYFLADKLIERPTEIIAIMEETLASFNEDSAINSNTDREQNYIKVRLINLPESESIKIGSHRQVNINKLVSFDGVIRRKGDVKPRLKYLKYLCTNPSCNFSQDVLKIPQFEEKAKILKACPKCKSGVELVSKVLEDSMFLILEQDFSERADDFDSKQIHIKLDADLTDETKYNKLKISEKIRVIGILREITKPTKGGADSINYDYLLEANNVIFLEQSDDMNITKDDEKEFIEFAKSPDCFTRMRDNYIPDIYGNELVKEAMMLQHIGSSFENKRNESHLLLLGDPSTGKTNMIDEDLKYSIKSVYASGTSSTKAGLTATALKDELTGSWVLEGGVLPRANGGIAGCDELDKLSDDDADSLTEALEQQRISVHKANISAVLQTKCSFIAGANPKFGKFDDNMDITRQICFNPALLSRFDLIFILRDVPDEAKDSLLISHMLETYDSEDDDECDDEKETISKEFIKKYLYYSKTNFKPVLGKSIKKMIDRYYVSVRKNIQVNHYVNFTLRQIQGVVRFACAYAKFHHKNIVDEECIKYAYNLFNKVLSDLGTANITAINNSMLNENFNIQKEMLRYFLDSDAKKNTLEQIRKKFNEPSIQEIKKALGELKTQSEIFEPIKDTFVLLNK